MRGKGINYDTGFSPGGRNSREDFDAGIVRREMHVIARELHCTAVRVSGGVFRATLWREVMAAMLARPLHVVGDAEGTALGAAALGLFALGDAPALADAASQMAGPETAPAAVVEPDHDLVARYDLMRASLPDLVAGLGEVAALCLPTATPSAPVR